MAREPKPFETIQITRKALPEGAKAGYKVYSDADNFTVVQAETASAALAASGLANAHKIERVRDNKDSLVEVEKEVRGNEELKN